MFLKVSFESVKNFQEIMWITFKSSRDGFSKIEEKLV